MKRFLIAGLFVLAAVSGPAIALVSAPPAEGALILVIAPPWVDVNDVVAAAQGELIGPTVAPMAAMAISAEPGFSERLADAGAWAMRDATAIATICGIAR